MRTLVIVGMMGVAGACGDTRDGGGAPRPMLPAPVERSDAGGPSFAGDAGLVDPSAGSAHVFPARDLRCAGSSPPCATTVPVLDEHARTAAVGRELGGVTLTYAIHVLSMPPASPDGRAVGFNLDGMDSGDGDDLGDCSDYAADYRSATESTHDGVDNVLESIVPTIESVLPPEDCPAGITTGCLDATLQESIDRGVDVMLLEVSGVDSLVNDDHVTVTLYTADVAGAVTHDANGRLAAGQTYATSYTLATAETGDIFQGRLRVRWPSVLLPSGTGSLLPRGLAFTELRANLGADGFTAGALGGAALVEDLVRTGESLSPGSGDSLRAFFEEMADIQPSADPYVCLAVSTGLELEGVSATRLP